MICLSKSAILNTNNYTNYLYLIKFYYTMFKSYKKLVAGLLLGCSLGESVIAQTPGFTDNEYKKALWMTTRMYGGQRSGDNNWYVYNHLPDTLKYDSKPAIKIPERFRGRSFYEDNDGGYDLSGGWHDCGDHVKFGQTEFYSGYVLLKGYAEFPIGYDDRYSQNYKGYKTSGKWNWEDSTASHDPDGIPDIVNEVKHATDFFIKCAKDANTFYYQIGDGNDDHKVWCTSVLKQRLEKSRGGQLRTAHKNPNDASMPSFCGATLALMSRVYRNYNANYADSCLAAALNAYSYAKKQNGTIPSPDGPPFYPKNESYKDDLATMCAELYWATGEEKYKKEALAFTIGGYKGNGDIYPNDVFNYANNGEIAIYNLALLGKPRADSLFKVVARNYINKVDINSKLFLGGDPQWGPLRYNANAAWIVALNLKLTNQNKTVHPFIYDQIDYILGKNSLSQSFIVGFGNKSPRFPHHRDIYRADGGDHTKPGEIPLKNRQAGFMVGGKRNPSEFKDDPIDFVHTEGGIDYQAGLVGALGYITSIRQPVDQSKFPKFQHLITSVKNVEEFASGISVYPNPSVNSFSISTTHHLTLKIYNNSGHLVNTLKTGEGENTFGNDLQAGIYHLNFFKDNHMVKSMNVVKN